MVSTLFLTRAKVYGVNKLIVISGARLAIDLESRSHFDMAFTVEFIESCILLDAIPALH